MSAEPKQPVFDVRVASRGPRFFRTDGGEMMFEITLDSRSKIGPRLMVSADKHQYPKAWADFERFEAAEAEERAEIERKREQMVLERVGKPVDDPHAKAAHEADKAERQAAMDRKRGGGL